MRKDKWRYIISALADLALMILCFVIKENTAAVTFFVALIYVQLEYNALKPHDFCVRNRLKLCFEKNGNLKLYKKVCYVISVVFFCMGAFLLLPFVWGKIVSLV